MSQTHYEDITLEQLVAMSQYIFIVERLEPFEIVEKITIHKDEAKYPPFMKVKFRFRVAEQLLVPENESFTGRTIEAVDCHVGTEEHVHRLYYLEGRSKSPIYERYQTEADFSKEAELILFVNMAKGSEFYFLGYESASRKKDVIGLVKKLDAAHTARPIQNVQTSEKPSVKSFL